MTCQSGSLGLFEDPKALEIVPTESLSKKKSSNSLSLFMYVQMFIL